MSRLLYADLGKRASDLFSKDFPDKPKLEINARSPTGVQLQTVASRLYDGSFHASVQPKYSFVKEGVTISATADTNKTLKLESVLENALPGLKATIGCQTDTESLKTDLEYRANNFTLTTALDVLSPKGTTFSSTAAAHFDQFSIGASTDVFLGETQELRKLDGILSYSTPELQVTAFSRRKGGVLGASYYQRVSPLLGVGAELAMDLNKPSGTPAVAVAGQYIVDPLAAGIVKGKLANDGRLSFSYGQRITPNLRATVGTTLNTYNLGGTSGHNFGLSLVVDL